ncbi:uncharacterized protein PgNI_06847 [Pyricularia grisea]|uniref:Uncharacterized protein n=1 Tax=Pyricularia grisea TaxID=148305 RepID=A0A6P8B0Y0_PYRGI|nr:uncharacterized protein PgNI_06847 [Pyricularia grisea]TLD08512.1 hypothetical protein PgNI_06847 [Pyricularia grisea]
MSWLAPDQISLSSTAIPFNGAAYCVGREPTCAVERAMARVQIPETGMRIMQRDSQTSIVDPADQLVLDGNFAPEVTSYLRAVEQ